MYFGVILRQNLSKQRYQLLLLFQNYGLDILCLSTDLSSEMSIVFRYNKQFAKLNLFMPIGIYIIFSIGII